jgi:protein-disulfide isomerase
MQEEQVSNSAEVSAAPAVAASTQAPFWKDLLIPASIVIAGVAVGLGMYFGGSGSTSTAPMNLGGTAQQQQQNLPADPSVLIPQLVDQAGVDRDEFVACFDSERTAGLVQEDVDNAIATGGRGTPWSVVIGPNGNTFPLNGAVPAATIQQVIELARSGAEADPGDTDQVNPVTDADHVKGDRNAAIKVVEYSDFDCPFCGRFHDSMNSVVESNDDVAWVYRHFPLDQLHPQARAVAQAAECVAELGGNEAFWTFTDGYFAAK